MPIKRGVARLILRLAAVFLVSLVAAALFLGATVKIMFPPEHLKEVLTHQLQKALNGRPVQIRSAAVVLFRGIRVSGLRVVDIPYLEGAQFLSSGEFTASLRVLPLLAKRFSLGTLRLEKPSFSIVRLENGALNISDLLAPGAGLGSSPDIFFSVDRLEIVGGDVRFVDRLLGVEHRLKNLSLAVDGLSVEKPFSFEMRFEDVHRVRGESIQGKHRLAGKAWLAGFDFEQAWLREVRVQSTVQEKSLEATLSVERLAEPKMRISVSLPRLDGNGVGRFLGIPLGWGAPESKWNVSAQWKSPSTLSVQTLQGQARSIQVRASGSVDFSSRPVAVSFKGGSNLFELSDLAAFWSEGVKFGFGGRVQAEGEGRGPVSKLAWDRWSLNAAGAAMTLRNLRGEALDGKLAVSPGGFSLNVKDGNLVFDNNQFENLDLAGERKGRRMDFRRFKFSWNGSPVDARWVMDRMGTRSKSLTVEADAARLDIRRTIDFVNSIGKFRRSKPVSREHTLWWLRTFKDKVIPVGIPTFKARLKIGQVLDPNFSGRDARIVWDLKGFRRGMKSLKGDFRFELGPGRILDIPHLREKMTGFDLLFLPFAFLDDFKKRSFWKAGSELKDLDYKLIHGEYLFQAGAMKVRSFFVDGDPISAVAEGEVDWSGERLDTHVLIRDNNPGALLPRLFMTADGKAVLSFFVREKMEQPEVKVDFKKVPAGAVERAIESGRTIKF